MAGAATASLLLFIHMEEMQIEITTAKISQCRRPFIKGYILVVTLKADSIVFGGIRSIECLREIFSKYPPVLRAMRVVTGVAITLFDGAMPELAIVYIVGNFFVAGKT